MPMINANDQSAELVHWFYKNEESVEAGEIICSVETTKSTVDVIAERGGYLRILAEPLKNYPVGFPIAFIAQSVDELTPDHSVLLPDSVSNANQNVLPAESSWTKKAKILAERSGLDIKVLAREHLNLVIDEEFINTYIKNSNTPIKKPNLRPISISKNNSIERVLILGGGGGAALVLDILSRSESQKCIGILDNDLRLEGKSLQGVDILGNFDTAVEMWREGKFDSLISTVVRDVNERAEIFQYFSSLNIPFTNVIDPNVRIGNDCVIGQGNLVIYGSYIAVCATLGDNNFLAAGSFIEHHTSIGSHCTFGPRSSLSGGVTVGDKVKLGTHVAVEPQITIGSNSIIASGITVTKNIEPNCVVKSQASSIVRMKN